MMKIFLLLVMVCSNLLGQHISWERFSLDGVELGKRDGYISTSSISNQKHQITLFGQAKEKAFGIAVFNLYEIFGIVDTEQKLDETPPSARLPFGALVSDLLEDPIITNDKTSNDMLINKIKETFLAFNKTNFVNTQSYSSAVVTLFLPNKIVVAHVGNNRAVSSDLISIMTHDHKPFLPDEKKRIEKVGGIVENNGLSQRDKRLFTGWSISRMFGDIKVAGVIAEPDVSIFDYNFKMLATTSSDLDTEFFPVARFLKRIDLPLYTKNKTSQELGKNIKASSGYRFIIMASAVVWNSLPTRIADYFSWDFSTCNAYADDENGFSDTDKALINYHCSRLGVSEIATHIVESVLAKDGLSQKSLELATELLHVASVQGEAFNLGSFLNPDVVQKKSLFQKIKGWFVNKKTREQLIFKEINKIRGNESIAIIAWDPKNESQKKLKSKLPQRKAKK